jgi:hypothetical protein
MDLGQKKRTDKSIEKAVKDAGYRRKNRTTVEEEGQSEEIGYTESQLAFNSKLKLKLFFHIFNFEGLLPQTCKKLLEIGDLNFHACSKRSKVKNVVVSG